MEFSPVHLAAEAKRIVWDFGTRLSACPSDQRRHERFGRGQLNNICKGSDSFTIVNSEASLKLITRVRMLKH